MNRLILWYHNTIPFLPPEKKIPDETNDELMIDDKERVLVVVHVFFSALPPLYYRLMQGLHLYSQVNLKSGSSIMAESFKWSLI